MRTIYKYTLGVADRQIVMMPDDPLPLSVQMQNGRLCMWAQVDSERLAKEYRILMVGTGQPMPVDDGFFIGTVQVNSALVVHVFAAQG